MFCQSCGQEIPVNASNCPYCGSPSSAAPNQAPNYQAQNYQMPAQAPVVNNYVQQNFSYASPKSRWAAFFICLFFGALGIHRFYAGKVGTGILWLLTCGMFGIGWLVDLIVIAAGTFKDGNGMPMIN